MEDPIRECPPLCRLTQFVSTSNVARGGFRRQVWSRASTVDEVIEHSDAIDSRAWSIQVEICWRDRTYKMKRSGEQGEVERRFSLA